MSETSQAHAQLMDATYRYQRLIYDVTRKFYLLGRDHLITSLAPEDGTQVLEIACGTGRNLAAIKRRYPTCRLYGLDISEQMLSTARAKLGDGVALAQADACAFDPTALFGVEKFDRIVLSYSISMIPDWENAIHEAIRHLRPDAELHIVDFGDQQHLPKWFKAALRSWLTQFHVTPRDPLKSVLEQLTDAQLSHRFLYRHYAQYAKITMSR